MTRLVELLEKCNITLSTAESLTSGMIGAKLAENEGISKYYKGGVIAYSNEVKHNVLGVDNSLLKSKGPYNFETTEQMCEGVRRLTNTRCAIAVSGVSGPGDDQGTKQGTVYTTISLDDLTMNEKFNFKGDRQSVREQTTKAMLEKLEDVLYAWLVINSNIFNGK